MELNLCFLVAIHICAYHPVISAMHMSMHVVNVLRNNFIFYSSCQTIPKFMTPVLPCSR